MHLITLENCAMAVFVVSFCLVALGLVAHFAWRILTYGKNDDNKDL